MAGGQRLANETLLRVLADWGQLRADGGVGHINQNVSGLAS